MSVYSFVYCHGKFCETVVLLKNAEPAIKNKPHTCLPLFWYVVYFTLTGSFISGETETPVKRNAFITKIVNSHWLVLDLWWRFSRSWKLVFTKKIIFRWLKDHSYHFIFFPSLLKINTAIFTPLNDRPPASRGFHVAVGLPMGSARLLRGKHQWLRAVSELPETGQMWIPTMRLVLTGFSGVNLCGRPRSRCFSINWKAWI